MKFLEKPKETPAAFNALQYARDSTTILGLLQSQQSGFCAYSEKWLQSLDSVHVEHYDPRLKKTATDGFHNWYAVVGKINGRRVRKKLKPFLPLPSPWKADTQRRIIFDSDIFAPLNPGDDKMRRLIAFVRANDPLTVEQRQAHIELVASLLEWKSHAELRDYMLQHPVLFSFPSALESKLGLPVFEWIKSHLAKSLESRAEDA